MAIDKMYKKDCSFATIYTKEAGGFEAEKPKNLTKSEISYIIG